MQVENGILQHITLSFPDLPLQPAIFTTNGEGLPQREPERVYEGSEGEANGQIGHTSYPLSAHFRSEG